MLIDDSYYPEGRDGPYRVPRTVLQTPVPLFYCDERNEWQRVSLHVLRTFNPSQLCYDGTGEIDTAANWIARIAECNDEETEQKAP